MQNNNLKRIQSKEYVYLPKNTSPYLRIQQNKQERSQIIKNKANHERYISDIIDNNIKNGHNPLKSFSLNKPANTVKVKDYNEFIESIENCLKNSQISHNICETKLSNLNHSHARNFHNAFSIKNTKQSYISDNKKINKKDIEQCKSYSSYKPLIILTMKKY